MGVRPRAAVEDRRHRVVEDAVLPRRVVAGGHLRLPVVVVVAAVAPLPRLRATMAAGLVVEAALAGHLRLPRAAVVVVAADMGVAAVVAAHLRPRLPDVVVVVAAVAMAVVVAAVARRPLLSAVVTTKAAVAGEAAQSF